MSFYSGKWGSEAVTDTEKKVVQIYVNGNFTDGKSLYMEAFWSINEFISAASQRLGMQSANTKRVFSSDGIEIDDCMMIEDNDILFISRSNEDYIQPAAPKLTSDSPKQSRCNSETPLPHTIGGFVVGKFLGRGGFGEVREGDHQVTGEKVALKFLRKADVLSVNAAERTAIEIQCLTALKHPNIISLQHHTESVSHIVLVFELMGGGDLYRFLQARGKTSQAIALPEDQARHLFQQLINAISYAHNQHICHRDLKLENILLKGQSLDVVKIADFGLSQFYRPGSLVKVSCGTLAFQAPETFKAAASAGPPLDVWSLGVILYAVLCARLPFGGYELAGSSKIPRDAVIKSKILKGEYKMVENLSVEAKDLIRRMLHVSSPDRASTADVCSHCWLASHSYELMLSPPMSSSPISSPIFSAATFSRYGASQGLHGSQLDDGLDGWHPKNKEMRPSKDEDRSISSSCTVYDLISIGEGAMPTTPIPSSPINDGDSPQEPSTFTSPSFKLIPLRRNASRSDGLEVISAFSTLTTPNLMHTNSLTTTGRDSIDTLMESGPNIPRSPYASPVVARKSATRRSMSMSGAIGDNAGAGAGSVAGSPSKTGLGSMSEKVRVNRTNSASSLGDSAARKDRSVLSSISSSISTALYGTISTTKRSVSHEKGGKN